MQIVEATANDDDTLASHYLALWESYGTPKEHFAPDARAQTIAFLREGRQHRGLNAFLALIDNNIAGSAACQLHISPYPEVIKQAHRRFGYIWSVYVEPQYRKRGDSPATHGSSGQSPQKSWMYNGRPSFIRCWRDPV
jgi:ribosomal protein S18 acetylase RimI-like enzyme